MRISALRLFNVKRFAGRGVAIEGIGDGVNVLCAANEFGKSTSFEALHALFFQPHSGTPGDVQKLRPYSGGSPMVEADISTSKGRFRITKQYYSGKSARVSDLTNGRLLAQADEAENFIRDLVKGGTAGPAGLLWVRQGITGIEKRKASEEDNEKQVRASLLESVQGEVEAVTGGRRMAEILARTTASLSELVTATGRPKAGGRLDAAIKERDALSAKEERLEADVRALREHLDRREAAVRRLAGLGNESEREAQTKAIERAQADFDNAKALAERLRAAQAEHRLARERRDTAERELKAFGQALATAERLTRDMEHAQRQRAETLARRDEAAGAIEAARKNAEAAEEEEREARQLLARLEAALRAREAGERLAELRERLEAAEGAQRTIEQCEARLVHVLVPAKAVDELQLLEIEIARFEAVADAARPSVALAYEAGAQVRVTMNGATLNENEPRSYDRQAELAVPGVGTILLRTGHTTAGDDQLARASGRRQALLSKLGVASLALARERQVQAERIESEIAQVKARLSVLAPDGLKPLREAVAAARAAPDATLELKGEPDAVRQAAAAAETRRLGAREAARAAEPVRQRADDAFVEARAVFARIEAERAQAEATLGASSERDARHAALEQAFAQAEERLETTGAEAQALAAAGPDLASVEAALKRLRSVAEASSKEVQALRETIAGLNAEIRARSEDAVEESWRECVEARALAEANVHAFEKEVAILQRLVFVLEAARLQARELYLAPVMNELKPLLSLLFEDVSIAFDDRTLLPQTILRGGIEEDVERLSGGMREQLSVLTRLAFARLLARDGRPAPIILDDALVYSDDDRIEKMFDALHRQASDQQIIVFSCRQRAFQRLGGNVLQMTDWHPTP